MPLYQCFEPSKGHTGTSGMTPRRRDGTRRDGTASRRPVQGKGSREMRDLVGPPGPMLGFSRDSKTHGTVAVYADGRGDKRTAGIVRGAIGGIRRL